MFYSETRYRGNTKKHVISRDTVNRGPVNRGITVFEFYILHVEELFSKAKHIRGTTDRIIRFFKFLTEPQKLAKGIYLQTESLDQEAIKERIL